MAKLIEYELPSGLKAQVYLRLNNFQTLSKHAGGAALFRAFASQEAFEAGKSFIDEFEVFVPYDPTAPAHEQAYRALADHLPHPEADAQIEAMSARRDAHQADIDARVQAADKQDAEVAALDAGAKEASGAEPEPGASLTERTQRQRDLAREQIERLQGELPGFDARLAQLKQQQDANAAWREAVAGASDA